MPGCECLRILLVDDSSTNRIVGQHIIQRLGHTVDLATSGQEALSALEQHAYDLVLMDIQMPEMDGLEVTGVIRDPNSAARDHGVPIIAMTAQVKTEDRERFLAAGMNDHVAKPINPEIVEAAIARVCFLDVANAPTDTAEQQDVVFDEASTLQRMGGDADILGSVLAGFMAELPDQVANIHRAQNGGRLDEVHAAAHKLKGGSGNVGAGRLWRVAGEIEFAAKEQQPARVAELLGVLDEEVRALKDLLATGDLWDAAA